MAAKTPVSDRSTAGFTDATVPSVFGGVNAVDASLITQGTHHGNAGGFKLRIFHFADIDDADTWTSGISGIIAVAWQPDEADTDKVGATLTTADSTTQPLGGVITFDAENANSTGWLWVLSAGS